MEGLQNSVQKVSCTPIWSFHEEAYSARYASLYFMFGVDQEDNELITLELIHGFVEILDAYFGNVCCDFVSRLRPPGVRVRSHLPL